MLFAVEVVIGVVVAKYLIELIEVLRHRWTPYRWQKKSY